MSALSLPFMRTALLVSLLAGNVIALLGLLVLMRRVAFYGLSASQLAALGAVIGILMGHGSSLVVALFIVLSGLMALSRFESTSRVPQESLVACLYVFGAGMAVLILSKAPWGEAHTLNVFFGNVLTLGKEEVWKALILFVVTVAGVGLWFFRWIWISFDPLSAEISGVRLGRWNLIFYGLFALAMTLAIQLFGVLLAFAYLLLPASMALILTNNLRFLLFSIVLITTGATLAGFLLSFQFDLPTGPFVASLLAVLTLASALIKGIWKRFD